MMNLRCMVPLQLWIVLALLLSIPACSSRYEGEEFTFSAPPGYDIKPFITPYFDRHTNLQELIFSGSNRYPYFIVYRRQLPPGSDLEGVLSDYKAIIEGDPSYLFISQKPISLQGRTAIELVHREFIGEPYVQTREVWVEHNGWAYSLVCVTPATAAPGAVIPVSEKCLQLAQDFQFK